MNVICFHCNDHKKINGTLFYCYEYFCFIKKYIPNLKLLFINSNEEDIIMYKSIFENKYKILYDDIFYIKSPLNLIKLKIDNMLILDVFTYKKIKDFTNKIKIIRIYSDTNHDFLNNNKNHIFYGYYNYQKFNIKTRLKLYKELHKTFEKNGNKIFLTGPNIDYEQTVKILNLNPDNLLIKQNNNHYSDLFEQVNKIIYFHNGNLDTNNRIIVESFIHNIDIDIIFNNNFTDSVFERYNSNKEDLYLDESDILIKDFLKDCIEKNNFNN